MRHGFNRVRFHSLQTIEMVLKFLIMFFPTVETVGYVILPLLRRGSG
jgi:hypothetical protein